MRGAFVVIAILLAACGGQVSTIGGEPPTGNGGGGGGEMVNEAGMAAFAFVSVLQGSGGCLPQSLPTDADGETTCAVVEALYGGGGEEQCAAHPGLQPADAPTIATITSMWSLTAGTPVCVLRQLSGSALSASSCGMSSEAGFCYVTGGPVGNCDFSIGFSYAGSPPAGAIVGLACPN